MLKDLKFEIHEYVILKKNENENKRPLKQKLFNSFRRRKFFKWYSYFEPFKSICLNELRLDRSKLCFYLKKNTYMWKNSFCWYVALSKKAKKTNEREKVKLRFYYEKKCNIQCVYAKPVIVRHLGWHLVEIHSTYNL